MRKVVSVVDLRLTPPNVEPQSISLLSMSKIRVEYPSPGLTRSNENVVVRERLRYTIVAEESNTTFGTDPRAQYRRCMLGSPAIAELTRVPKIGLALRDDQLRAISPQPRNIEFLIRLTPVAYMQSESL